MAMIECLTVLYRGPLSSCNYECPYCPFAKRRETGAELENDRLALRRFVDWIVGQARPTAVFFTPWGEALIRPWYRDAIVELSRCPTVVRVAVQTNLHASLAFLEECDTDKVGLWCTYHPGQASVKRFLGQCGELDRHGVSYSVGIVGLRGHIETIEQLRVDLRRDQYLWINAYKREPGYYSDDDIARLTRVDPHFTINNRRHDSGGHSCRTGHTVISVDGAGDARRCHFVRDVIGNIYDPGFARSLRRRQCPNETCGCHIGYVHMDRLDLYGVYGDRVLERIPVAPFQVSTIGP